MTRSSSIALQRILCALHGNMEMQRNSWLSSISQTASSSSLSLSEKKDHTPKHFRDLYEIARQSTAQYNRSNTSNTSSNNCNNDSSSGSSNNVTMSKKMTERLTRDVTAKLRPYQLDAVTWALEREGASSTNNEAAVTATSLQQAHSNYLDYLFEDEQGNKFNLNVLGCKVTSEKNKKRIKECLKQLQTLPVVS